MRLAKLRLFIAVSTKKEGLFVRQTCEIEPVDKVEADNDNDPEGIELNLLQTLNS